MEHIITRRRGFRKLLAFLLCMASILGLLPAQAFAMSVGQTASSWLGDQYVGSDGNHYRAPAPYTYLAYHTDGTIDVHTSSGGNAYRHYMLTDSDGISHQVYCVETLMLTGRCISLLRRVVMSWRSLRLLQQSRKNPAVKLLPGSFPGRMTVLILPGLQL